MLNILLKTTTASILLAILVFSLFLIDKDLIIRFDFTAFVSAANIIKKGAGGELYNFESQKRSVEELVGSNPPLVYKHPPTVSLLYLPATTFSLEVAYKIYVVGGVVSALAAAILLSPVYLKINNSLVIFLIISYIPGIISIVTGQFSYLLLLIWIYIQIFLIKRNSLMVGIVAGLLYNKPQYLLFTPFLFLFVDNRKKFAAGLLISLFIHSLISFYVVGHGGLIDYPSFLINSENATYGSDPYSQISFTSLLYNLTPHFEILMGRQFVINAVLYLLTVIIFAVIHKPKHKEQYFHSATLFTLFFTPHLWDYDLVLVLPALLYLVGLIKRYGDSKIILFVCMVLYLAWVVRFVGYPYFISILLLLVALFIINIDKLSKLKILTTKKSP